MAQRRRGSMPVSMLPLKLGHEQEDFGLCRLGNEVELVEDGALDLLRGRVDDELRVDVDVRRPLPRVSAA
jgi:hypothetical protein